MRLLGRRLRGGPGRGAGRRLRGRIEVAGSGHRHRSARVGLAGRIRRAGLTHRISATAVA